MFATNAQCGVLVSFSQLSYITYIYSLKNLAAQINDYAARHYHGLVEFYATRWHYFFDTAESGGCSRDSSGYKTFEANILQMEQKFANMTSWPLFNQTQVDDYYPIIHGLWHKYKDLKPAQNENDTV